MLEDLQTATAHDATGPRRPHYCVITWGERGLPGFRCVIESLVTKYTVFDADGVPLRATCVLKVTECERPAPRFSSELQRDRSGLASRDRNR